MSQRARSLRLKLTLWSALVFSIIQVTLIFAVLFVAGSDEDGMTGGPLFYILAFGTTGAIAALVASWLIAGRAVSPIHRLSEAAQSVSPDRPGERIRVNTTDDEISRLQSEMNSALERLEASSKFQEEFITNVSHELKTPIAVVLTESQVVKLGASSIDKYREYVDRVEEEMQRLGRLVESFLTLTRSELATPLRPIEVAVHDVVLEAVQHCSAYAERYGIRLVPNLVVDEGDGPDAVLEGDPDLLRTMLDNLLRNAVHHAPRGSAVDIDASTWHGEAFVTVYDRGPGIPEEYLERVFERFVQVPESMVRTDGTGIGLSIARNIAQLHGGNITASINAEGGCSFVVRLPLSAAIRPDDEAERIETATRSSEEIG